MPNKYTPEDYDSLDCDEYRGRFPGETIHLTDEQLYDIVMSTEDDMEDDEWRELFREKQSPPTAA